jgi:hypothetical protein
MKESNIVNLLMLNEGILHAVGYVHPIDVVELVEEYEKYVKANHGINFYKKGVTNGNLYLSALLDKQSKIRTYVSPN